MSDKPKWPLAEALAVAEELRGWLAPFCERIEIAGSIRRRKRLVGDIELVYVPHTLPVMPEPTDLFAPVEAEIVDIVEVTLTEALYGGALKERQSKVSRRTWGPKNKLATHVASGIPVDFFATTEEAWWNYLVCRTGGSDSNIAIACAARLRGWKWEPTKAGFISTSLWDEEPPRMVRMGSEREVFEFVGLPFLEPQNRP